MNVKKKAKTASTFSDGRLFYIIFTLIFVISLFYSSEIINSPSYLKFDKLTTVTFKLALFIGFMVVMFAFSVLFSEYILIFFNALLTYQTQISSYFRNFREKPEKYPFGKIIYLAALLLLHLSLFLIALSLIIVPRKALSFKILIENTRNYPILALLLSLASFGGLSVLEFREKILKKRNLPLSLIKYDSFLYASNLALLLIAGIFVIATKNAHLFLPYLTIGGIIYHFLAGVIFPLVARLIF